MYIRSSLLLARYSFMKDNIGGNKMILNKTYGYWSVLFSIAGTFLLITTYLIAPDDPQGMIVVIMKIMLALAVIFLPLGIISSIFAIKKKEVGTKKYVGILLPVLIVLFYILVPIIMGIGFMVNDKP